MRASELKNNLVAELDRVFCESAIDECDGCPVQFGEGLRVGLAVSPLAALVLERAEHWFLYGHMHPWATDDLAKAVKKYVEAKDDEGDK